MKLENLDWENSLIGDSDSQTQVDILVGLDYYWGLVKPGTTLLSDHLAIQETKFGYVLSGSWDINNGNAQQRVNHQFLCMGDVGEAVCHKLWDLETLGITENIDSDKKKSDDNVLKDFNQTIRFVDGRYLVLLRFRRWKYGLTADISKAFLQIRVFEQDQDVHRFLWDVRNQARLMRFDRVVFGDASSPFLLNATIKYHLNKFHDSVVVSELRENLYVDDWLSGSDSQDEIVKMASEAENILGQGGFPLAKWGSNSTLVGDRVVRDLSKDCSETLPRLKILGISWSTSEDCFLFETFPVGEGIQFTKRLVLGMIARIFDPLGFLNTFIIGIKIMFQEIWRLGLSWDEPLPLNMQKQMSIWVEGLRR
ncbi:DUF1759 and Peptidase A17 and DUF1758 and RVT 1 d omain containing protein [Elysia marginata]|uniref:DUF1759 and Peptidase A17 and DUF1758 and RVT 1 d omain containing protein n=1 Tax=Elysia marginata TaxID=1093978 RepID=A0AAV4HQ67_9GAST|nr:DUF1759 and Peptidase A17 and DUF1758 and RVT 1 d omain containing protein [Elysia marginata]